MKQLKVNLINDIHTASRKRYTFPIQWYDGYCHMNHNHESSKINAMVDYSVSSNCVTEEKKGDRILETQPKNDSAIKIIPNFERCKLIETEVDVLNVETVQISIFKECTVKCTVKTSNKCVMGDLLQSQFVNVGSVTENVNVGKKFLI